MSVYESAENYRLGKGTQINVKKAIELYEQDQSAETKEASSVQIAMLKNFSGSFSSNELWNAVFNMMMFRRRSAKLGVNDVPYNLILETDSYDNIKNLINKISAVEYEILKIGGGVAVCSEAQITDADTFLEFTKNKDILFIVGCSDVFFNNIDLYSNLFRKTPATSKILCLNKEQITRLRNEYEAFHFRVIGHEKTNHTSVCNYTEDDVIFALMTALSAEFDISEEFATVIVDYVKHVYPRADLKSIDFVSDLYKRVVRQHLERTVSSNEIDAADVPYYKEKVQVEQKPSEQPATEKKEEILPTYTKENVPTDGHKVELRKEEDTGVVNVLLLSLSTMGKMEKNDFYIKGNEDGPKYAGIYQLDPIPKMLSEKLAKKGQYLDKIIMLETSETKKPYEKTIKDYARPDNSRIELYKYKGSAADFFKAQIMEYLRPLDENATEKDRFIEFDINENEWSDGIFSAVNKIRELKNKCKKEEKTLNLYVDIHGGFRGAATAFEAILSLLEHESIKVNAIYSTRKQEDKLKQFIFEDKSHRLFSFVSGINEFRSFGRIDSLKEYFKFDKDAEKHPLIEAIEQISDAISLCDTNKLDDSIKDLRKYFSEKNPSPPNIPYLDIFEDNIKDEFGSLITNKNITPIDEIEWCLKKRLYQPALTLLECRVPCYLFGGMKDIGDSKLFDVNDRENLKIDYENKTKKNKQNDQNFASEYLINEVLRLREIPDLGKKLNDDESLIDGKINSYFKTLRVNFNIQNSKKVVTAFLGLHRSLKNERNKYNHMSPVDYNQMSSDMRLTESQLKKAITIYIGFVRDLEKGLPAAMNK